MKELFLISVLLIASLASAKSKIIRTKEYGEVFQSIAEKGRIFGASNVLVVFDIDDTLLVTPDCRRSDGSWARGNSKLFVCPTLHTEMDISHRLDQIQKAGYSTISLTARGNVLIESTQRELARWHENALPLTFKGYPFHEEILSIPVPKTKRCKKSETPPCLTGQYSDRPKFIDGVMYANATNKGLALKALLKDLARDYQAIIFIDDNSKNAENIHAVYKYVDSPLMEVFLYLRHRSE